MEHSKGVDIQLRMAQLHNMDCDDSMESGDLETRVGEESEVTVVEDW